MPATINFTGSLNSQDWWALVTVSHRRASVWMKLLKGLILIGPIAVVAWIYPWAIEPIYCCLLCQLVSLLGLNFWTRRALGPNEATVGYFTRQQSWQIDRDGIHVDSEFSQTRIQWQAFRDLQVTTTHLYLVLDRSMVIVLPRRWMHAETESDLFHLIQQVRPDLPILGNLSRG